MTPTGGKNALTLQNSDKSKVNTIKEVAKALNTSNDTLHKVIEEENSMNNLLDYLGSIQSGPISNKSELESLLATCWDEFDGSGEESTEDYKLLGRMEDIIWKPPILSFTIERHGATVRGSSRAELHEWEVNVKEKTASCYKGRFRQLQPKQPKLDVGPIAKEIVQLILDCQEDERFKRNKDGSVLIKIGKIIPAGSALKQTLGGRRRRFREKVNELLSNAGWQKVRTNVYSPPSI